MVFTRSQSLPAEPARLVHRNLKKPRSKTKPEALATRVKRLRNKNKPSSKLPATPLTPSISRRLNAIPLGKKLELPTKRVQSKRRSKVARCTLSPSISRRFSDISLEEEPEDLNNGQTRQVAKVEVYPERFPVSPNETLLERAARMSLTMPILHHDRVLPFPRHRQTGYFTYIRYLPSLMTALLYPELSLPEKVEPIDVHCIDNGCMSITEGRGGARRECDILFAYDDMGVRGDVYTPRNVYQFNAVFESSNDQKRELETEYRVCYDLLRSGLFKLDFLGHIQYVRIRPLPFSGIYPDAIAWPYGFFQYKESHPDDKHPGYTSALLSPKIGPSLRAYRSMSVFKPLTKESKVALVETLMKIHKAGYIHGSIDENNIFIYLKTGIPVLRLFSHAQKCDDEELKQKEMELLRELVDRV